MQEAAQLAGVIGVGEGVAVLAEALAVVAEQDDQRFLVQAALPQAVEQPADLRVGRRDLAVVRVAQTAAERLRRRVRLVGVVVVHPEESRP